MTDECKPALLCRLCGKSIKIHEAAYVCYFKDKPTELDCFECHPEMTGQIIFPGDLVVNLRITND